MISNVGAATSRKTYANDGRKPARVSLVINTLNEEKNIVPCILSVGDFADEVIVCDMHSSDRTCELAKSLGARVVMHRVEPFVEKARRFAVEQASGEWILLLDADERATPGLLGELKTFIERDEVNVVLLRWTFLFMGRFLRHGAYSAATLFRFFRRARYLEAAPPDIEATLHTGRPAALSRITGQFVASERFIHLAYPTLDKYVRKTLRQYSLQEATDRYRVLGERPNLLKLLYWPTRAFFASYFFRLGFLDGIQGLISSIVWSHMRFVVLAHLYDLEAGRADESPWTGLVAAPVGYGVEFETQGGMEPWTGLE